MITPEKVTMMGVVMSQTLIYRIRIKTIGTIVILTYNAPPY